MIYYRDLLVRGGKEDIAAFNYSSLTPRAETDLHEAHALQLFHLFMNRETAKWKQNHHLPACRFNLTHQAVRSSLQVESKIVKIKEKISSGPHY